jgi:hypothetical protein
MLPNTNRWLAVLALSAGICCAQVPDLSGTWRLNVEKSNWGKKPKPIAVVVQVEHREPQLKYTGTATDLEGHENKFEFSGVVDGQERAATTSYGPGKAVLKRVNATTTNSVYRSDDGKFTENATTTISGDGRTLTRRLNLKSPDGNASWTEVYERQ